MRADGARAWSLTAAISLLAPTGSVGLAGVQETAEGIGKTLTEGVTEVEQRAKVAGAESRPAGERLEKRTQGFGESSGMAEVRRSFPAEVLRRQQRECEF